MIVSKQEESLSATLQRYSGISQEPVPVAVFRRLIEVERARAERSDLHFAMVVFRFVNANEAVIVEFGRQLAARIRLIDHLGWLDAQQARLGVILGDTKLDGAEAFVNSVIRKLPIGVQPAVEVYLFPDQDSDYGDSGPPPAERNGARSEGAVPATQGMAAPAEQLQSAFAIDVRELSSLLEDREELVHSPLAHRPIVIPEPTDFAADRNKGTASPATFTAVRPLHELFVRPLPWWKRSIDLVAASLGLLVLSPLLLTVAALIKWTSPGPVLFLQRRTGLGGRPFTIYKFRTMCIDAEAKKAALRSQSEQDGPAFKMAKDPRITPIGRILRKTCIDELPQLWNVVLGDMTLVGPRPLPVDEANGCLPWQRRRLEVTPGLTCIWQVYGKSKVSFAEWMRMDIRYIRTGNFIKDLRLIGTTVLAVLRAKASQ
jgi:lipopolysaccharide/colanic/teichoic acid biosynthesis glycosyltransferase